MAKEDKDYIDMEAGVRELRPGRLAVAAPIQGK